MPGPLPPPVCGAPLGIGTGSAPVGPFRLAADVGVAAEPGATVEPGGAVDPGPVEARVDPDGSPRVAGGEPAGPAGPCGLSDGDGCLFAGDVAPGDVGFAEDERAGPGAALWSPPPFGEQ
jgi:hypothetical protein